MTRMDLSQAKVQKTGCKMPFGRLRIIPAESLLPGDRFGDQAALAIP